MSEIKNITPIKLEKNNPYANGRVIVFADGTQKLVRSFVNYTGREGDDYHTVRIDDTITGIAYKYYKNNVLKPERYWFIIADANNIRNPLDLTAFEGEEILIPNVLDNDLITS